MLIARTKDNNYFYERKVTLAKVLGGDVEIPPRKLEPIEALHQLIIERTYGKGITVAITQAKQLRQGSSRQLQAQNSMGILDGNDEPEDKDEVISSGKELLKAVLESDNTAPRGSKHDLSQSNYGVETRAGYVQSPQPEVYHANALARDSSGNFAPVAIEEFKGEDENGNEQFDSDKVVLVQDHIVDETNEQYQAHNIGKSTARY